MNDSMAHPGEGLAPLGLPYWKTALGWAAGLVIGILFLISGLWKISDVQGWAVRLAQARVPESLSVAGALLIGVAETLGGIFLLVPRFRRWGAIFASSLLLVFLVYFALNFNALRGLDCSCFPWLKRVVGPGFFIGDGLMLLLAACAGIWAKPPASPRTAFVILGAVSVFALVSYGVGAARQTGARAPETVTVDGQPYSLAHGKFFLFFFHPECSHCQDAAKRMAQLRWGDTKVVAIPVGRAEFAREFLRETGLQASITPEFEKLKILFGYTGYPFGVALENGRAAPSLTAFEGSEPGDTLRRLGLVY